MQLYRRASTWSLLWPHFPQPHISMHDHCLGPSLHGKHSDSLWERYARWHRHLQIWVRAPRGPEPMWLSLPYNQWNCCITCLWFEHEMSGRGWEMITLGKPKGCEGWILGRRPHSIWNGNNPCVSKCLGFNQYICLNVWYAHGLKIWNAAKSKWVDLPLPCEAELFPLPAEEQAEHARGWGARKSWEVWLYVDQRPTDTLQASFPLGPALRESMMHFLMCPGLWGTFKLLGIGGGD